MNFGYANEVQNICTARGEANVSDYPSSPLHGAEIPIGDIDEEIRPVAWMGNIGNCNTPSPGYGLGLSSSESEQYAYNAAANIFVGDVAGAENNAAGATGSMIFGLTGLDVYKDVADLGNSGYEFWKEPTWGRAGYVVLNVIAIIPVIGVVKNVVKGAEVAAKNADEVADTLRHAAVEAVLKRIDETPGLSKEQIEQLATLYQKGRVDANQLHKAQLSQKDIDDIKEAAQNKARLDWPGLDGTGKVHGNLPHPKDLDQYHAEDLRQLQEELRQSVKKRIKVTSKLGPDRPHGQRQGEEQDLIEAIEKYLSGT